MLVQLGVDHHWAARPLAVQRGLGVGRQWAASPFAASRGSKGFHPVLPRQGGSRHWAVRLLAGLVAVSRFVLVVHVRYLQEGSHQ